MAKSEPGYTYGPYHSAGDALLHIAAFQSLAFPTKANQDWGVVWVEFDHAQILRPPVFDQDGNGFALIYEWRGPCRPPSGPARPVQGGQSMFSRLQSFYRSGVQTVAAASKNYIGNPVMQALGAAHNVIVDNPKTFDVINVGLDIYGVASSGTGLLIGGFASITGVGTAPGGVAMATSFAAFTSTTALLGADGRHLYLELRGNEDAVKEWEATPFYDITEKFMPIVALFDPAREAIAVLKSAKNIGKLQPALTAATKDVATANTQVARAAAQVDRDTAVIGKVETMINAPGHISADVDQKFLGKLQDQKTAAEANAAAADARAQAAAAKLARLQKQVRELKEDVDKYLALKVHFLDGTLLRDGPMNAWSAALYGLNNPFAANSGQHINEMGTLQIDEALQQLVPRGFNSDGFDTLKHYIHISVAGVGAAFSEN